MKMANIKTSSREQDGQDSSNLPASSREQDAKEGGDISRKVVDESTNQDIVARSRPSIVPKNQIIS